ncbi:MAG: GNAT family N-acetyltransferase [Anaerolineae bacterium]|nr:GNAT family N-acetyltransferase [Anaerolineae bacterium]
MLPPLPKDFVIHPARLEDVEEVARTISAYADQYPGEPKISPQRLLTFWQMPGTNLETDSRVVLNPAGQMVAYLLMRQESYTRCDGFVHPDYQGLGIGRRLVAEGEQRAALTTVPPDAKIFVRHQINHEDRAAAALLTEMGYRFIRFFVQMGIHFGPTPPPTPEWSPGITVRTVRSEEDLRLTYEAAMEAFRDHWDPHQFTFDQWLHFRVKRPDFEPSLWFLAMDGDEIVGTTLGYPNRDDDPKFGWISEVSVRRNWRKRGIGMALMYSALGEFHRRGFERVGLNVDGENPTGAKRLYERVGMSVVTQADTYEKVIREGVDAKS